MSRAREKSLLKKSFFFKRLHPVKIPIAREAPVKKWNSPIGLGAKNTFLSVYSAALERFFLREIIIIFAA